MSGLLVPEDRCAVCGAQFSVGDSVDYVEGQGNLCHNGGYCVSLLSFRTGEMVIANTREYGHKPLLGPKDWRAVRFILEVLFLLLCAVGAASWWIVTNR